MEADQPPRHKRRLSPAVRIYAFHQHFCPDIRVFGGRSRWLDNTARNACYRLLPIQEFAKKQQALEKVQGLGKEEEALKQRPLLLWVVACRFCPPGLFFLGLLIPKAFPGHRFPARRRGKSLFEP